MGEGVITVMDYSCLASPSSQHITYTYNPSIPLLSLPSSSHTFSYAYFWNHTLSIVLFVFFPKFLLVLSISLLLGVDFHRTRLSNTILRAQKAKRITIRSIMKKWFNNQYILWRFSEILQLENVLVS